MRTRRHRPSSDPTPEELIVWKMFPQSIWNMHVRNGGLRKNGSQNWYKLDIAFPEILLDVEIDGGVHRIPRNVVKDAIRTKMLEGLGWTVLRFWNHEVLKEQERVKMVIESTISRLQAIRATS
jgi:very-short-patch-repair endonuclease